MSYKPINNKSVHYELQDANLSYEMTFTFSKQA